MNVLPAAHVYLNVHLKQFLKEIFTRSILINVSTVEHVLMYVLWKPSARLKHKTIYIKWYLQPFRWSPTPEGLWFLSETYLLTFHAVKKIQSGLGGDFSGPVV
jgi:hypothetical protein